MIDMPTHDALMCDAPKPDMSAREASDAKQAPVGWVTSSAWHYELGPIALAVVNTAVPADAPLVVASAQENADDPITLVAAAQEAISDLPPN
jgi:glycine cleavage system aminomethyltransferase T